MKDVIHYRVGEPALSIVKQFMQERSAALEDLERFRAFYCDGDGGSKKFSTLCMTGQVCAIHFNGVPSNPLWKKTKDGCGYYIPCSKTKAGRELKKKMLSIIVPTAVMLEERLLQHRYSFMSRTAPGIDVVNDMYLLTIGAENIEYEKVDGLTRMLNSEYWKLIESTEKKEDVNEQPKDPE